MKKGLAAKKRTNNADFNAVKRRMIRQDSRVEVNSPNAFMRKKTMDRTEIGNFVKRSEKKRI